LARDKREAGQKVSQKYPAIKTPATAAVNASQPKIIQKTQK
jgi:hypothetical protein